MGAYILEEAQESYSACICFINTLAYTTPWPPRRDKSPRRIRSSTPNYSRHPPLPSPTISRAHSQLSAGPQKSPDLYAPNTKPATALAACYATIDTSHHHQSAVASAISFASITSAACARKVTYASLPIPSTYATSANAKSSHASDSAPRATSAHTFTFHPRANCEDQHARTTHEASAH